MKQLNLYITLITMVFCISFSQFSVVFAAEHEDASLYIMRLINDTRKAPLDALVDTGLDTATVQANMGTEAWTLDQGLPPLAWNSDLYASALAHANDMIANLYYSYNSQNGDTVENRIEATGFQFLSAGESLGILSFDNYIEPMNAAKIIFDNILIYEMGNSILSSDRNILNPDWTETGIVFVSIVADLGLNVPVNIYLVVADFARPVYPRSFIIGNLSVKTSDYPEFKAENTLPGMDLVLRRGLSARTNVRKVSGTLGFFQFEMPFGFFLLDVQEETTGNLIYRKSIFGLSENYFLDVFIDQ
jgi:uncharacterized protein YkwD